MRGTSPFVCAPHSRHHGDTSCTQVNNCTKWSWRNLPVLAENEQRWSQAPWKHRCWVFSQWKNQVLLWTSFLGGEEAEDWDERTEEGKRKNRWREEGKGNRSGRLPSVTQTWNQLVATGNHLLSLWSVGCERGHAVKDDKLSERFFTDVKTLKIFTGDSYWSHTHFIWRTSSRL